MDHPAFTGTITHIVVFKVQSTRMLNDTGSKMRNFEFKLG
jgi:hypothetical protein